MGDNATPATIPAFASGSGQYVNVTPVEFTAGVQSGKLVALPGSNVTTQGVGAPTVRAPGELEAALAGGERAVPTSSGAALGARRRELFDNVAEGISQTAQGFVDALSLGLIHDPTEAGKFAAE